MVYFNCGVDNLVILKYCKVITINILTFRQILFQWLKWTAMQWISYVVQLEALSLSARFCNTVPERLAVLEPTRKLFRGIDWTRRQTLTLHGASNSNPEYRMRIRVESVIGVT